MQQALKSAVPTLWEPQFFTTERTYHSNTLGLQAFHITGKENFVADYHSRFHADASDWRFDSLVFAMLLELIRSIRALRTQLNHNQRTMDVENQE